MRSATGWFPVGLSAGLEAGTSAGTRLFGQELVVWRDVAGTAHVWEDRCPHRGMRLSFGFMRDDRIACLYHGWQFDAAGRCRFIPAHPALEVPDTIRATCHVSAERSGILWTFHGAPEPDAPPPGGEAATTAVRSMSILASEAEVRDAVAAASPGGSVGGSVELPSVALGSRRLRLALQPLAERETCLHLLVEGDVPDVRRPASLWAEAVRRRAEAGDR